MTIDPVLIRANTLSMDLLSRIQTLPLQLANSAAQDIADAQPWIRSAPVPLRDLLVGTAGASPYLAGLIVQHGAWLQDAVTDPEGFLSQLMITISDAHETTLAKELRVAKARMALLVALMDVSGAWRLSQVTKVLTDFADRSVEVALNAAIAGEQKRRKLRMLPEGATAAEAGLVAFAMGKMGAYELNYSSDIDLIMLIDHERYSDTDWLEARPSLIRAVRTMSSILSERTEHGYVFRTDLRLRPDPSVTPVALSMEAAERYFESTGRAWERAAWVKARPCAGDIAAGQRFLKHLRPFVWRRQLDFAAIQEAHDMRLRIRDHKGHYGPIEVPGHDVKLGRGGIREIEFFTQTRQIIAGGRDTRLRVRGTLEGLDALVESQWIEPNMRETLRDSYIALRHAEHRAQMILDAQTHILPESTSAREQVAALSGESLTEFDDRIGGVLRSVDKIVEAFFTPDVEMTSKTDGEITAKRLEEWERFAALRSPRARAHFSRIAPRILERLNAAARPEEAFDALTEFIAALPAGVQLFALFEANPQLVDLLTDITATTPALGRYLRKNVAVIDGVIAGDFFDSWPGTTALTNLLTAQLADAEDYESKLDHARSWANEWRFRIGVHLLRGLITPEEAGAEYASLAEAVVAALFAEVINEYERKHGQIEGGSTAVLAMGSLGAGRLTPVSDLDMIVVYDAPADAMSDGKRVLGASQYYARLTKALVTALSAPMAQGKLYEADMRLRPSGQQGPLAVGLAGWVRYQREQAWTWEHLALTRGRPIAGASQLRVQLSEARLDVLRHGSSERSCDAVLHEMEEMRQRIRAAKSAESIFDAKIGPGRLQEIELAAQIGLYLSHSNSVSIQEGITALAKLNLIDRDAKDVLLAAYTLFSRLHITSKLISETTLSEDMGRAAAEFIAKATQHDELAALTESVERYSERANAVLDKMVKG